MEKYTALDKELEAALRERVFDDEEFVMGVFAFVREQEDRKEVLDFINAGEEVNTDTVSGLVLDIDDKRRPDDGDEYIFI